MKIVYGTSGVLLNIFWMKMWEFFYIPNEEDVVPLATLHM
jgi:hypothetical protein